MNARASIRRGRPLVKRESGLPFAGRDTPGKNAMILPERENFLLNGGIRDLIGQLFEH